MVENLAESQIGQPIAQPSSEARPQPETRVPELDGLRGIAILMVLLCHYVFAPGIEEAAHTSLQRYCFGFFASGVQLFFVLSGFLIGGILLDHRTSPRYFIGFYGRRVCRIFPVYYGFLLITALSGIILHAHRSPTPVFDARTPFWTFFVFLQNFSLSWYSDWKWITVTITWSLALEEQFYLTLPIAVRTLSRRTLVILSWVLILIAPIVRFLFPGTAHTFGSLLHQAVLAEGLAAGFLCAVFVRSGLTVSTKQLVIATLLLTPAVVVTLVADPVACLYQTSLVLTYSCILLLALRGAIPSFRSSGLVFFGTISYALYLVHYSALVLAHHVLRHETPSLVGGRAILATSAAFVLSIAGCVLSWHYLERPLLLWGRAKYRY